MGKFQIDAMIDDGLDYVSANATEYYVCTSEPASRAAAISASLIAAQTPSFTGPVNGDTSGRKLTVDALSGVTLTGSGTANHLVLCSGTDVVYITTCTPQALSSGGQLNVPAWDIEIADVV